MLSKGKLIVISAPSGGGKTTLREKLMELLPGLSYSVSVTTRIPRDSEINGKDYCFIPEDVFRERVKNNEFIEWAEVHGNLYGTPGEFIEKNLQEGKDTLLDIDVQGALKIKERFPRALLIFICPPSMEVLERRLQSRGTDSPEEIRERLITATEELSCSKSYDCVIVNRTLEDTLAELCKTIENYIGHEKGVDKNGRCSD